MIYKHEIKDGLLILYFDYSFEFSNEFKETNINLKNKIKDYIKKMHIKLTYEKVVIVVGGITIATILLGQNSIESKTPQSNIIAETPLISEISNIEVNNTETIDLEQAINTVLEKEKEHEKELNNNDINVDLSSDEITNDVTNGDVETKIDSINTEQPIITKEEEYIEESTSNVVYVNIKRSNGSIITMDIDDYLIGVIGAEMPASFNIEALKAQSIVARTYALKKIANNQILTDTVSTQSYKDNNELRNLWGSEFEKYYDKIKNAVESTKGLYLTYNGDYIDAVYHSTSNGKTEDAAYVWGNSVPYLKSVDSPWDISASSYLRTESKDFNTILNILGIDLNEDDIEILERNSSGRITSIRVGNNIYTGVEFRNMLGLRSADFDLNIENGNLIITTRGYGHGVGMSEYGANGMANSGYNYEQILKHYYQGVQISKM